MQHKAPFPAMGNKYKRQIDEFFLVDDFGKYFQDYEILEMEEEKLFKVGEYDFKGFPDMVGNHKKHGLSIVDYKTAKTYEGAKLKHNIMQLYLYAIPIKEKYGKYPDHLIYFYPKEMIKEQVIEFDMKELERTIKFVNNIVPVMEKFEKSAIVDPSMARCLKHKNDFFGTHLCNYKDKCLYKI